MPILCRALTATKPGTGERRPAFYPPLREAALCHESGDSCNSTWLSPGRGCGQCGQPHGFWRGWGREREVFAEACDY